MAQIPQVDARVRVAYNPNITSTWYSSLLELMTMITMLLTAASLVREKVHGILERLLVSPLRPSELFIAKIIPTIVVILILSLLAPFGVVKGIFHTPLRASFTLFYAITTIYIFFTASLGIAIAVIARNIAQVAIMLLIIMYPMLFLSGAFTPPESMLPWTQYASLISPMRYSRFRLSGIMQGQ
jgi:ABC-2 type transport system permease protein